MNCYMNLVRFFQSQVFLSEVIAFIFCLELQSQIGDFETKYLFFLTQFVFRDGSSNLCLVLVS